MRPHGKYANVDPGNPSAFAECDRCGRWWNAPKMTFQNAWAGTHIYSTGALVCPKCYDTPNEQLRTIVLPPDPPPIRNARVPDFAYEESGPVQSTLTADVAQSALILPIKSVEGFVVGNSVWVQLNNANYAEMEVSGVDALLNRLTITAPLPFSAPYTGSVTVANVNG